MSVTRSAPAVHGSLVPYHRPMKRPVAVFSSRTEADIAKARLASEGIDAMVVTDSAGGWEPQLDAIRGVRVVVDEIDADDAIEILGVAAHLAEGAPPAYPTWAYVTAGIIVSGLVLVGLTVIVAGLG